MFPVRVTDRWDLAPLCGVRPHGGVRLGLRLEVAVKGLLTAGADRFEGGRGAPFVLERGLSEPWDGLLALLHNRFRWRTRRVSRVCAGWRRPFCRVDTWSRMTKGVGIAVDPFRVIAANLQLGRPARETWSP
jgi:hypothetical protein